MRDVSPGIASLTRATRPTSASHALIVRRRPAVVIRPARLLRQADRRINADRVACCGAEFECLELVAEQVDVINRLRALITAVGHPRGEGIAAVGLAERDVFRPQRNPYLVADFQRMQQRRLPAPALAEIDHTERAVAADQRTGELIGGA